MTELNERQKKFIGAVLARKTDGNKPILEAVLKSYAINEGIVDFAKKFAGKTKDAAGKAISKTKDAAGKALSKAKEATSVDMGTIPEKRSIPDYAALRKAMMFEPDCWDRDLTKFYQNCELVQYYLSNYGIRDFNAIVGSDAFKKAVEAGKTLDKMRVNPLARDDARRRNMHECLERFYEGDTRVLIEGIMSDFDESETVTIGLVPMFEAREDNIGAFREAMAGIANFIRRHGYYPWGKFLKENQMLLSRAHRFDQTEYPEAPERPTPKMAADVRKAYIAGCTDY